MKLTREEMREILAMKPGIELDKMVAQHVMGLRLEGDMLNCGPRGWRQSADFCPSNHIGDAWEVVEEMKKIENMKFSMDFDCSVKGKWNAGISYNAGSYAGNSADTAPEAICKTALLVIAYNGRKATVATESA